MSVAIRNGSTSTNGTTKRPEPSVGPQLGPSAIAELSEMQKMTETQIMKRSDSPVSCKTRTNTGCCLASKETSSPYRKAHKSNEQSKGHKMRIRRCNIRLRRQRSTQGSRSKTGCIESCDSAMDSRRPIKGTVPPR